MTCFLRIFDQSIIGLGYYSAVFVTEIDHLFEVNWVLAKKSTRIQDKTTVAAAKPAYFMVFAKNIFALFITVGPQTEQPQAEWAP